jgi:hypothetical protein
MEGAAIGKTPPIVTLAFTFMPKPAGAGHTATNVDESIWLTEPQTLDTEPMPRLKLSATFRTTSLRTVPKFMPLMVTVPPPGWAMLMPVIEEQEAPPQAVQVCR